MAITDPSHPTMQRRGIDAKCNRKHRGSSSVKVQTKDRHQTNSTRQITKADRQTDIRQIVQDRQPRQTHKHIWVRFSRTGILAKMCHFFEKSGALV